MTNTSATAWHYTDRPGIKGIQRDGLIRAHAHAYTSPLGVPMPDQVRVWFSMNEHEPTKYIFNQIAAASDKSKKAELLLAALEQAGGAFFRVGYSAALLLPIGGFVAPVLADARLRAIQDGWRVSLSDVRLADCIGVDELDAMKVLDDEYIWKRIWTPVPAWLTAAPWRISIYTQFPSTHESK